MALMCDMRTMAASATVAEAYINMGLIAGDGGGHFLPRPVGTARALEMLWRGNVVTAAEAERIGLVNHVFADERLLEETCASHARLPRSPSKPSASSGAVSTTAETYRS
jgi:enoyl-CoA hydratase/carnithine racemase